MEELTLAPTVTPSASFNGYRKNFKDLPIGKRLRTYSEGGNVLTHLKKALFTNSIEVSERFDINEVIRILWKYAQIIEECEFVDFRNPNQVDSLAVEKFYGHISAAIIPMGEELVDYLNQQSNGRYKKAKTFERAAFAHLLHLYLEEVTKQYIPEAEQPEKLHYLMHATLAEVLGLYEALNIPNANRKLSASQTTALKEIQISSSALASAGNINAQDLKIMVEYIGCYLSAATRILDAQAVADDVFFRESPVAEQDWEALSELYQEVSQSPDRGISHANILIKADEIGFRKDSIMILNLTSSRRTMFPLSAVIMPLDTYSKKYADLPSSSFQDMEAPNGDLSRVNTHDSVNVYLHPDGEISVDSFIFSDPANNKRALGPSYAKLKAYLHYAIAAETTAEYVLAPREIGTKQAPKGAGIPRSDLAHVPKTARKIHIGDATKPDDFRQLYDCQFPHNGKVEYARVIPHNFTPSKAAFERSKSRQYNPSQVKLGVAIINIHTRTVEIVDVETETYEVFKNEIEDLRTLHEAEGPHIKVYYRTFVKRTVDDEVVARRKAVLSTTKLAEVAS